MPSIPETIFKYEGFTIQSLLNLKAQSIYFGSPRQFNDPYDCAITASFADPTTEELQSVHEQHLVSPETPREIKTALAKTSLSELRGHLIKAATKTLNQTRESFLNKNGVTCFSERNDNLLMWSHYGGQYKGICLEFRTRYSPFEKLKKVRYVKRMPSISITAIEDQMLDLYFTKSEAWEYEEEWRAIHNQAGTLFTYEPEALKAVYFGPDISRQALEIVCLILEGQNSNVQFWQGSRSESDFKVNFTSFTYTSHAEGKRRGLL